MSKLTINGYKDDGFGSKLGSYTCQINPASYEHNHSIKYSKKNKTPGGAGETPEFESVSAETVSFDILFDGTGVIPGTTDVTDEIKKLKKVAYYYEGSIHKPAFIELEWANNFKRTDEGAKFFKCHLTALNISYTLFKPDGNPLRAKAKVTFEEYNAAKFLLKKDESPDMTHVKIVRQGDTLPMLCYEVYEDASYYLKIAEVNQLDGFRELEPGQRLVFPPLKGWKEDE